MDQESPPKWVGVFENYARAYASKNYWRVRKFIDFDDLMQDCALQFAYICDYSKRNNIKDHALYMSNFQRCLDQWFTSIARKGAKRKEREAAWLQEQDAPGYEYGVCERLADASEELRAVLNVIANAPSDLLQILLKPLPDKIWSRELYRFCIGADLGIDKKKSEGLIKELRNLLS